jgi:transposase-like protein
MPEQRRRFSPQFKADAEQMVIETCKPIAAVTRNLGIHDGTLGSWVNLDHSLGRQVQVCVPRW